jgi:hypothetical protein
MLLIFTQTWSASVTGLSFIFITKDPRVVVVSPEESSLPPPEPVFEVELDPASEAIKGFAASDVAGELQVTVKNKIKQTKTLKRMPHFFISSSPFKVMIKQYPQKNNIASVIFCRPGEEKMGKKKGTVLFI